MNVDKDAPGIPEYQGFSYINREHVVQYNILGENIQESSYKTKHILTL